MAKILGINETIKALKNLGQKGNDIIEDVTYQTIHEMQIVAKREARGDKGKLRQSIVTEKVNDFTWNLVAGALIAPYAAFHEFGTGGLVEVPNEFKEMAWAFKGKGIKLVNIPPKPFMHPALIFGRKMYLENMRKGLNKLKL